jgi:hypothetical protein
MRSTRGRTRASKPHFTTAARVTAPRRSTETACYGDRELPAGVATGSGSRVPSGFKQNTNTRLKDGGISSYYRSREIGYRA